MTKKELLENLNSANKALISLSEVVIAYDYLLEMYDYHDADKHLSPDDAIMRKRLKSSTDEFIQWLDQNYRLIPEKGRLVPNEEFALELLNSRKPQKVFENAN